MSLKKLFFGLCLASTMSLSAEIKVLAFAGSARAQSYNKQLIQQAAAIAKSMGAQVTVVELKDYPMPIYNADLEAQEGMPPAAQKLRRLMIESNALIISSPEYNASISALLKNTLDWMSRGEKGGSSKEAFKGKKFAIMSASPSKKGGAKALAHLQTVIEDCGGSVIPLQLSVGHAGKAFDATGNLINGAEKELLVAEIQQLLSLTK